MSVRYQSEDQNRSGYTPSGGSHLLLHRAVVASTSLLALSAALGWSNPALAAGTCGAPAGGVVNCNLTSYPTGIEYTAGNAVDDLTVNVGSFAGQSGAVTIGDPGILITSNAFSASNTSEDLNVGKKVAITTTTYNDISVASTSSNKKASDAIVNKGTLTSAAGAGIYSGVVDVHGTGNATATGSVSNSGTIAAAIGIVQIVEASAYSTTASATAAAKSTVDNTGGITSYSSGIYAEVVAQASSKVANATGTASSTVTNSGAIVTSGDGSSGIVNAVEEFTIVPGGSATGGAYATTNNGGAITTSGESAAGLNTVALGEVLGADGSAQQTSSAIANNSGAIKTTGSTAYVLFGGLKYYEPAATGISSYGEAIAEGAKGAQAIATAGVQNSGSISTTGTFAHGIYALSEAIANSNGNYGVFGAAYSTVTNSGAIKTTGAGADGIYAGSYAVAGLTPAPNGSSYGTAKAVTTVENAGTIKTSGDPGYTVSSGIKTYHAADGIYASAYALGGGEDGARSTATVYAVNTGSIATAGTGAVGIDATAKGIGESYGGFATGGAYVTVVNTGSISTKGAGAAGIYAATTGVGDSGYKAYGYSVATAQNTGAIKTTGAGSDGMDVKSQGASYGFYASVYTNATAVNSGSIQTKGDGSFGIFVYAADKAAGLLSAPYSNANVVNTGDITTKGADAVGIAAVAATYSGGIYVYSAARSTITSTGAVKTSGVGAAGLYAYTLSTAASPGTLGGDTNGKTYAASTITNAGSVTTSGDGAIGIAAISKAESYSALYGHASAVTTVTNAGAVQTAGAGAYGVVAKTSALSYTPAASTYQSIASASTTVLNVGSISAAGAGANGIVGFTTAAAFGTTAGASASASTTITNAGTVTSAQGVGILAYTAAYASSTAGATATASSTVINAGSVTASGPGGTGVLAAALASTNAGALPGSATVVNAAGGSIVASGAGGIGVKAEAAYSTVVTYAGSTISGGTGAGAVGVYETGALNIIANGGTIGSGNDHAIEMEGLAANIIKNTGTIEGYVTMHATGPAEQNVFYNYGTWVARGGNSDFKHSAGGGSNLVNESTGKIVVVGNQSFTNLDDFTNVGGVITMTQAASAGLGSRPAFETLTVSGDFTGVGGQLDVDATTQGGMNGDVLKIKGAASGGTSIVPTILGTPGATSGNGILVVAAHATTGASDFTLKGNAANGDEVAGAFEYGLSFVPGAGTSGDWYLQSQVYPGVYQFGQIGSSGALVADSVNVSLDDLMSQAFGVVKHTGVASNDDTAMQVASTDNSFVPSPDGPGISGWGRYDESRFDVDPNGSKFADYRLRVDAAQFGGDYDWHNAWNEVLIGGYVAPFHSFADFSSFGTHIGSNGTAYALYGLWFNGPWEGGLRLNYDPTTAHISDTFIGTNAGFKANEEGIQAAVRYDNMNLVDWADFTPSAELNYGTVDGVNFTDGAGDPVVVGRTNDFWGKLNGRFSTDVVTAHGLLVQPYVNIGALYRGDTSTKVSILGFSSSTNINGWDGDFAVGVNTSLMANLSLSAQVDYLAGSRVDGWTGFLGLRYTPGADASPAPAAAPMMPPPPPPPPPPTKTFIVFFDFNKSNLTAEAQSVVSEAVKAAKTNGMVRVLVTGHTDTVGSDSYNMGLSVRRAQSVKDEMVRQGMGGDTISIEGKGFHDPLVPTGPGVREPQNRRAVIDLGG